MTLSPLGSFDEQPNNRSEFPALERLRSLVAQHGHGLTDAEFIQRVLELVGIGENGAQSLSLEDGILAVLAQRRCSKELLSEVETRLRSPAPARTVKAAAHHSGVSERTLERHWRMICASQELHHLFRLIGLVPVIKAAGTLKDRVRAARIDLRTAETAARDLMKRPLRDVLQEPGSIIEVMESWLRP